MREVTERVRVYWNLHKKCWSVQSCKTNRVVLHTDELTIYKQEECSCLCRGYYDATHG